MGEKSITGVMIESNINEGGQDVPAALAGPAALKHWEIRVSMLDSLNEVWFFPFFLQMLLISWTDLFLRLWRSASFWLMLALSATLFWESACRGGYVSDVIFGRRPRFRPPNNTYVHAHIGIPWHRDQHDGGREQRDSGRSVGQEFETIKNIYIFLSAFFKGTVVSS